MKSNHHDSTDIKKNITGIGYYDNIVFPKVKEGRSPFNWVAGIFGVFWLPYKGMWSQWSKLVLPYLIIAGVVAKVNPVFGVLISIGFVLYLSKNVNQLYYDHLNKNKNATNSISQGIAGCLISGIINIALTAIFAGSTTNTQNPTVSSANLDQPKLGNIESREPKTLSMNGNSDAILYEQKNGDVWLVSAVTDHDLSVLRQVMSGSNQELIAREAASLCLYIVKNADRRMPNVRYLASIYGDKAMVIEGPHEFLTKLCDLRPSQLSYVIANTAKYISVSELDIEQLKNQESTRGIASSAEISGTDNEAIYNFESIFDSFLGKSFTLVSGDKTVKMDWRVSLESDSTYVIVKTVHLPMGNAPNIIELKVKNVDGMWRIIWRRENGVIKDNLQVPFAPLEGKVGIQAVGSQFEPFQISYIRFFNIKAQNGDLKYQGPCLIRRIDQYKIAEVYCANLGYVFDQAGSTAFFGQP